MTFTRGAGVALLAVAFGCSSSNDQPSPPVPSDAGPPSADAGTDAPSPVAFAYTPAGCGYTVSPPASRAFTDLALDAAEAGTGDVAPARVRIGLGGGTTAGATGYADPTTTAVFTWETASASRAAKVRIGTSPVALDDVHAGYTWTTPTPTSGLGTNEPPVFMHEVHVCGLQPGTTYVYQVGGGAAGAEVWSAPQTFTTVPKEGPIAIGVFGDARDQVTTWQLVNQRMRDRAVSFDLVSGDIVDFGTQASAFRTWLDAIWKDPIDPAKFITLGQQLMIPIAGNHENESSQYYGNFATPGDGPYAEQYGSMNVGNAHFVWVDDQPIGIQPNGAAAKATLAWLDADLAKADGDRTAHPFVVVMNHRALYSSSKHAADTDVVAARTALAPIFDAHHVDLVINGHEHEYERSKPLRAGAVQATSKDGTTYVVNAGAGADAYAVGPDPGFRETATAYGGATGAVGCYGILTLDGAKLRFDAYSLTVSGADAPIDTFELTR